MRYGGPEVIGFANVPEPVPGRGEILVRVHATTVNRTDCAYRSGHPWINRAFCGWPRPRVQVLGSEYAGVVVGIGEGVQAYAVGDRVFGFVDGRPGAHAELVAVAVDGLVAAVPANWDLVDAAPGMEAAHYAHACLRVTDLGPGDRVLVHGATGGIGTALIQLLHAEGVQVTAVCDRLPPGHPDLLTELGAHASSSWTVEHGRAQSEAASTR
jgi:NADPH:quinone reductase-like Zn-dependent oxidoreductase